MFGYCDFRKDQLNKTTFALQCTSRLEVQTKSSLRNVLNEDLVFGFLSQVFSLCRDMSEPTVSRLANMLLD